MLYRNFIPAHKYGINLTLIRFVQGTLTNSGSRKIRAVLDIPVLYRIFGWLLGGSSGRQVFIDKYLRPEPGYSILDIGCGPADILQYLPSINYVGFDINRKCIEAARRRFGNKGTFLYKSDFNRSIEKQESFDIVMAIGVLHHLDDHEVTELLRFAHSCMKQRWSVFLLLHVLPE